MADKSKSSNGGLRSKLAIATLIFSVVAMTVLAIVAIFIEPDSAMTIFNIVLPVFASWVGTILAFYFGRENFESANQQVRELVDRLTPEQRAKAPVTSVMRSLLNTAYFQISEGKSDQDVKLSELIAKFGGNVSRLPIIAADNRAKYMIHEAASTNISPPAESKRIVWRNLLPHRKKQGLTSESTKVLSWSRSGPCSPMQSGKWRKRLPARISLSRRGEAQTKRLPDGFRICA